MWLQTDQELLQNEIKKLNKKCNVNIFTTDIKGGKAFATEQKLYELKKECLRLSLFLESWKNKKSLKKW